MASLEAAPADPPSPLEDYAYRHRGSSPSSGSSEHPRHVAAVPLETEWITEDLITLTQNVWGRHLGREIQRDEAIEMLINVQGIAMAFHLASTEDEASE